MVGIERVDPLGHLQVILRLLDQGGLFFPALGGFGLLQVAAPQEQVVMILIGRELQSPLVKQGRHRPLVVAREWFGHLEGYIGVDHAQVGHISQQEHHQQDHRRQDRANRRGAGGAGWPAGRQESRQRKNNQEQVGIVIAQQAAQAINLIQQVSLRLRIG